MTFGPALISTPFGRPFRLGRLAPLVVPSGTASSLVPWSLDPQSSGCSGSATAIRFLSHSLHRDQGTPLPPPPLSLLSLTIPLGDGQLRGKRGVRTGVSGRRADVSSFAVGHLERTANTTCTSAVSVGYLEKGAAYRAASPPLLSLCSPATVPLTPGTQTSPGRCCCRCSSSPLCSAERGEPGATGVGSPDGRLYVVRMRCMSRWGWQPSSRSLDRRGPRSPGPRGGKFWAPGALGVWRVHWGRVHDREEERA